MFDGLFGVFGGLVVSGLGFLGLSGADSVLDFWAFEVADVR